MFSQQEADKAVRFIQDLKHGKAIGAGTNFILQPWQRKPIEEIFGTLNEDGRRQYRTSFWFLPRKNGKSEIAAGTALKLLTADKEYGAEVYSAAYSRDQASLVFNTAATMVRMHPTLSKVLRVIDSQKRIVYPKTGSFYRAIAADASGSHGFNAHAIIFDELHTQKTRELWDVLTSSTGARVQPLTIAITTAGMDKNSICYEQYEYAKRLKSGAIEDKSFHSVIYEAEPDDPWDDEATWYKANPALGTFRSIEEMRQFFRKAKEIPALENTFRMLYLNQWVSGLSKWMSLAAWDKCYEPNFPTLEELSQMVCYGGMDLSSTTDLTAIVWIFMDSQGILYVIPTFYMPLEGIYEKERADKVPYRQWISQGFIQGTPGNTVDYDYIQANILTDRGLYRIHELAFDPWNATQLVLKLAGEGIRVAKTQQGYSTLSAPTKELMKLILDRGIRHNGHPVLRWMIDSMQVEMDPAGNLKPSKEKSTTRIDGVVALIMAISRWIVNGNHSVYSSERGLVVI